MSVTITQLGSGRRRGAGVRIGTVRRPPRGVRKTQYKRQNWFDVWLPNLAPSAALMRQTSIQEDGTGWRTFERRAYSRVSRLNGEPNGRVTSRVALRAARTESS